MERQKQRKKQKPTAPDESEDINEEALVEDLNKIDNDFSEILRLNEKPGTSQETQVESEEKITDDESEQIEPDNENEVVQEENEYFSTQEHITEAESSAESGNFSGDWEKLEKYRISIDNTKLPSAPAVFEEAPKVLIHPIAPTVETTTSVYPQLEKPKTVDLNHYFAHISKLKPYPAEKWDEYYFNPLVAQLSRVEDCFINNELDFESRYSRHILFKLLVKYSNSRHNIKINILDINESKINCQSLFGQLWSVKTQEKKGTGRCRDHTLCTAYKKYEVATLKDSALNDLTQELKGILHLSAFVYCKNLYSAEICRYQIEDYIRHLLSTNAYFTEISTQHPIALNSTVNPSIEPAMNDIRQCISILFNFLRKPNLDTVVVTDIKEWLLKLAALQLRFASWQDHMLLLHHSLRCPIEVSWAASMIQVPSLKVDYCSNSPFDSIVLHHCLTILVAILSPIKKRNEFLNKIKKDLVDPVSEDLWVLVDSDGEEGMENLNGPRENDVTALFNQIPFETVFSSITCATSKEDGYFINSDGISGLHMLKTIAFFNRLVEILGAGLKTYEGEKYRQFLKRIARLIQHCVLFLSEMQEIFKTNTQPEDASTRLRIHFEQNIFVVKACYYIYSSQQMGTWQYLVDVPFELLSKETLYKLYYAFNRGFDYGLIEDLETNYACKLVEEDAKNGSILKECPTEDVLYLLQVFGSMALSRDAVDYDFVTIVVVGLYEIGFVNEQSRDVFSKTVRDLLANIAKKFPLVISTLLRCLKPNISPTNTLNQYLIKSLPLELWTPSSEDFEIIAAWLLNFHFESSESQIARIIFNRLNWNFAYDGNLFLPHDIHMRTAYLIGEVASKHVPETVGLSDIFITSLVKNPTSRSQFSLWCWNMASRLRLHCLDQSSSLVQQYLTNPVTILKNIPEFEATRSLYQSVGESRPLAIYLSLLVSQVGHSVPQICQQGLDLIKLLLNDSRHTITIRLIQLIVPMFLECPESLSSCDKFQTILSCLLNDKTYSKHTKDFIVISSQKPVLQLMGDMIQHQLINYDKLGLNTPTPLVELWLECLTNNSYWHLNSNYRYVIELVLAVAYQFPDAWYAAKVKFQKYFSDVNVTKQNSSPTGIMSFISAPLASVNIFTELSATELWTSLLILESEFEQTELQKGIWHEILHQLSVNEKLTVNDVLKKVISLYKLNQFSPNQLVIYKLATLIPKCSVQHDLFPIVCQLFFTLYLSRVPVVESSGRVLINEFVSKNFYDSNQPQMKKVKKKLLEAYEYHRDASIKNPQNANYHNGCSRIFNAFTMWLEEHHLIQSLPEQNKFRLISDNNRTHWFDLLDMPGIRKKQIEKSEEWSKVTLRPVERQSDLTRSSSVVSAGISENPKARIAERLKSYEKPRPPPPIFDVNKNPPTPRRYMNQNAYKIFQNEFKTINRFASKFNTILDEHKSNDAAFVRLCSELYKPVTQNFRTVVTCGSQCEGGANIKLTYTESILQQRVKREIEGNRQNYDYILGKESSIVDKNVVAAASQILEAVRYLAETYEGMRLKDNVNANLKQEIQKNGINLFFAMLTEMEEQVLIFPISEDICNYCAKKLGVFIRDNHHEEGFNLLRISMTRPDLINIITELFVPSTSPPPYFIEMYRVMVETYFKRCEPSITFVLFSKFDVQTWLNNFQPIHIHVVELKSLILRGLEYWNQTALATVQGILRRHLIHLFEYQFPAHCLHTIETILIELDENKFNPEIMLDLLNTFYKRAECEVLPLKPTSNLIEGYVSKFSEKQTILKADEILTFMNVFSDHFAKQRRTFGLHGLYPKYANHGYILRAYIGTLSFSYIKSLATAATGQNLPESLSDTIWTNLLNLFSPWIVPYNMSQMANWMQHLADKNTMLPWSINYQEDGERFVKLFVESINYAMGTFNRTQFLLGYILGYYDLVYANSKTPKFILEPFHNQFLQLDWSTTGWMITSHIDSFYRILQQYLPECHEFIGKIFMQIDWAVWLTEHLNTWDFPLRSRMMQAILYIFLKLCHEPSVREDHRITVKLDQAVQFPWFYVELNALEGILDWLILSTDPINCLKLPSKVKAVDCGVFSLIEAACGMNGSNEYETRLQLQMKRLLYVRTITRLLKATTMKHQQFLTTAEGLKGFENTIKDFMSLMIKVVQTSDDEPTLESNLTVLLNEFFSGLVNQSEQSCFLFINAVIAWQSTMTLENFIVSSMLKAINALNKDINLSFCSLLEVVIQQYLHQTESIEAVKASSWQTLMQRTALFPLTSIDIPGFFRNNLLLCLHLYMLLRVQGMSERSEKFLFLQMAHMEFTKQTIKLSDKSESKWFIIIGMIIQFCLTDPHSNKQFVLSIARQLLQISTQSDSWSDGLLGAIGLKKETMSNARRILCRCLACLIFSAFDEGDSDHSKIKVEYSAAMKELKSLISTKRFADVRDPVLMVIANLEGEEAVETDLKPNVAKLIRLFYKEPFLDGLEEVWRFP